MTTKTPWKDIYFIEDGVNPLIKDFIKDNPFKINTQDGYDFKVNELQGFVFSYDLSSLYFIKKGELYRIAKKY